MAEPNGLVRLSCGGFLQLLGCGRCQCIGDIWCLQEGIYRYALTLRLSDEVHVTNMVVFVEESLLVIRGLGIQTSTSSATYLFKASTRFIPTTQIQDIVIHEAFKGFEVRFYLAVIVDGERDVVVVFPVGVLLVNICHLTVLTKF